VSKLEPSYQPEAWQQLDALQGGADAALWDAVVDALEMICRDDQDGTGRSYRIQGQNGRLMWAVRVAARANVVIPQHVEVLVAVPGGHPEALIYYVGLLPRGLIDR
jgi:hypothetical protein